MSFWKKLAAPLVSMIRQPIESYIKLETSDDPQTLVANDGSLVTYVRVDGARQIIVVATQMLCVVRCHNL